MIERIMDRKEWIASGMLSLRWDSMSNPVWLGGFDLFIAPRKSFWQSICNRPCGWEIAYNWTDWENGVIRKTTAGRFKTREDAMKMMTILVLYGAKYLDNCQ